MGNMDLGERIAALETDNKNIHQELKDLKKQNQAIFEIASSVKVMATDIQNMKETIGEVKNGQDVLGGKLDIEIERVKNEQADIRAHVDEVDLKDARATHRRWESVRDKLIWLAVGAVAAYLIYSVAPWLNPWLTP